ncbi:hypothetical protein CDAR_534741 [Caerostris darwini]|uniref:Uncharacterized protein n=1 Tax=Caerostris darwini TaxID=1538125 RepID=A0AAV4UHL5_9ARAC|nr:hypothetical protein CDAR_534741 [Caerostris darwini]
MAYPNGDTTCVLEGPRKAAVTSFRLLAYHDCRRSYLFHIGIAPDCCTPRDSRQTITAERLDMRSALSGSLNGAAVEELLPIGCKVRDFCERNWIQWNATNIQMFMYL